MKVEMAEQHEDKDGFLRRPDMTLRDYFAGQALAGLCASPNVKLDDKFMPSIGNDCYAIADAMLEARK